MRPKHTSSQPIPKDIQFWKFRAYGFLKNLRFFDPFLILFLRDAGLSFLAIGGLISFRELMTNILEIPTGVLADAFGRRRAMLLGFGAYLLSFVLFYLGNGFWIFAAAMAAFALGETFRSGTHKAMILEYLRICECEELKVSYYGKTRAASQLGSALASLVAAGLVFWTGNYRVVFLATTVPYVLNFLLLASYPRSLDGAHVASKLGSWGEIATEFRSAIQALWKVLKRPATLRGLLSGATFDASFKTTKDYLQPIIQTQALALPLLLSWQAEQRTALLAGFVYFLIYLATSVASSSAGRVHGRLRSVERGMNLTFVGGLALLALSGAAAWLHWEALAIAAFVGVFVLQNLRRPMVVSYLADCMEHRAMASGLSVEVQIRTILMAGMAPLLGWLADLAGIGVALFCLSILVVALWPMFRVRAS